MSRAPWRHDRTGRSTRRLYLDVRPCRRQAGPESNRLRRRRWIPEDYSGVVAKWRLSDVGRRSGVKQDPSAATRSAAFGVTAAISCGAKRRQLHCLVGRPPHRVPIAATTGARADSKRRSSRQTGCEVQAPRREGPPDENTRTRRRAGRGRRHATARTVARCPREE